jgi:MBOAT, membrane-bound O-acyltransferase family
MTGPPCCRLAKIWVIGLVFRMKFYFVWTLSDASLTLAGFGFNGWHDKTKRSARWDRQTNGWPVQIELSSSTAKLMHVWNCKTGTFLRRCAHDISAMPAVKTMHT